ncbi:hypothetical protein [Streptomyces hygroscopicus]|uniref:hypothetical protein n=1 Tax=Streptomyces hygroscopicus TaxID=1912 RepID=UPI0022402C4B|nr:hypothetical protein [Streptomyces hygroscopicus]
MTDERLGERLGKGFLVLRDETVAYGAGPGARNAGTRSPMRHPTVPSCSSDVANSAVPTCMAVTHLPGLQLARVGAVPQRAWACATASSKTAPQLP